MTLFKALASLATAATLLSGTAQAASISRRAASEGCGIVHDFIGESREFTFETGGRDRTYRIHVPSNYDLNDERPLLLAFHGANGTAAGFESDSHYSDETINPDWLTAFPVGVNKYWQGPSYATPGVDDLAFVTALVNRIKSRFCVDETRIYAVGYSNGGGFTNTLACSENGGPFAAFAATAAALYTDLVGDEGCSPARSPLPFMETHGTTDDVIPYEGGDGTGGQLPGIREWLSRWQVRNGCGDSPAESDLGNGVTDFKWTCSSVDGLLRHLQYEGQDHGFPGQNHDQLFVTPVILEWLSQFST